MVHTKRTFGFFLVFSLLFQLNLSAQEKFNPWQEKEEATFRSATAERQIIPKAYKTFQLDMLQLKQALKKAPPRFSTFAKQYQIILTLPMPDGNMQDFSITDAPIMHPDLAARYPSIHSYAGNGLDDPTATLRFDVTPSGFHAMILSSKTGTVFIDPYAKGDTDNYIVHYKKDYQNIYNKKFTCHFDENNFHVDFDNLNETRMAGDCQLRNFELALACTGEYAQFHGGNTTSVLAAMNTTMTRVNGIYERDASITMTLIANNDDLIFLNSSSDPYTNNDGGAMLSQNQNTIDGIIGSNNYDIGHVFSTGGGGIAQLYSPCSGGKARGVTGLPSPVGDVFDIDFVCHEMGHQFGATHTQNNSCQRTQETAFEPGSGSTIMSYAGICAPNIQDNSDDYFLGASIIQMGDFITSTNCADVVNTSNDPPTINAGQNYIIPHSTPFELTADANDPDGDNLTYCWEQIDNQAANMPPEPTNTGGPLFRTLSPTNSPSRVFPRLSDLVNNNTYDWEVLPSVARTMNFNCMVRDNNSTYGCTAEDQMAITVEAGAGPFLVSEPNTNVTWLVGENQTITWDVANTNQAPVNAENVDISLSFDGGYTYPYTIATEVPNTGAYSFVVPNVVGNENRVRVQGSDNIFFDISNQDFTIEIPPSPTFLMDASPLIQSICGANTNSTTYDFTLTGLAGFNENVSFSVNGLPMEANASFSPNTLSPDGTVTMTIDGLNNVTTGNYPLEVVGTSNSVTISSNVTLEVYEDIPQMAVLTAPFDGATDIDLSTTMTWDDLPDANSYTFEIASSPVFGDSILLTVPLDEPFIDITGLAPSTVYYWHVIPSNSCGEATTASTFSFQTELFDCVTYTADDLPLILTDGGLTGYNFNVPDNVNITDVNVGLVIAHSWIGDLIVSITSPSGTTVELFDQPGFPEIDAQYGCDQDNILAVFDDAAPNTAEDFESTCAVGNNFAIEGIYQPTGNLADFNGESSNGTWLFTFEDAVDYDQGTLEALELQICTEILMSTIALSTNEALTVSFNSSEILSNTYLNTSASSNPADIVYIITSLPINGTMLLNGTPLLIGDTFTQADIDNGALTYQHNGNAATSDSFDFQVLDDSNGWLPNNTFNIIILNNTLNVSANLDAVLACTDDSNGQITVTANDGTPPYEYSIDGMNFQMSNVFGGLTAGDYTFTIRDANGFTQTTNTISISNPTALSLSATVDMNEITANANGGTGTLMYSIDDINFQMSNIFAGLANGTYTITVQDQNNCTTTTTAVVAVNTLAVTANLVNDISCSNANDGSIEVNVSGGTMPFQYSIDGGANFQASNVFDNLVEGTYSVFVQDAEGFNQTTNPVSISNPSAISLSATVDMDVITTNASGGTGNLMYSIDGMNFQMGNIFAGLANGTYTITVQDQNNCSTTTTAVVAVNTLVVAANIVNDISCNNANDGSIEVNVSGGMMPFQYSIDGGTNFQASNVFDNLAEGTYSIVVQDNEGFNQTTNAVSISNPSAISLSATVDMDIITANASGGTGNLMYSIDDINFQMSNIFAGLANGTYTLTVQDENGCTETTLAIVAVSAPLTANASLINDISCANADDASIQAIVGGGNPPYEYSIDASTFQSNNTFNNLSAGNYSITIRDSEGNTIQTNSIDISNPSALSLTATVDMNEITANASGGTGTLMYSIDGINFQMNNIFGGLANGTYTITVQDQNNCTTTTTAVVAVNSLVASANLINDISCNNANDGSIEVTVAGGMMPFQYSIDGGANFQASNVFDNLAEGTYSVVVQDAEGFTQTTNPVSISNPSALSISATVDMDVITANASGGTGNLMYSIDGMNFQMSNVFSGLDNGTYTITVQDENNCTTTTTAVVAVNSLVASANLINDISCNNANDGSIEVTVAGGMMPFQYSIDGGANFQASNVFDNLAEGTYSVVVQDAEGFTQTTNAVSISNPTALSLSATVDINIINANASGGTGNLMYSIDGMNFQMSNIFSGLDNGTYTITVQDENNCTTTTTAVVAVNSLVASANLINDISCNNANDGSIEVTVAGGTPPFEYSLNDEAFQSSNIFENLAEGTYTIVVQDSEGFSSSTNTITITNPSALSLTAIVDMDNIIANGSGGTGTLMYSIDGINFQMSNEFNNLENGDYTITIIDENDCSTSTTATVNVIPPLVFVSTIASDISCNNDNDGSITLQVSGGQEPYLYSINGEEFQSSNVFENLAAGTYQIVVQDALGVQIESSFTITNPDPLDYTLNVSENNIIIENAAGGTGNYLYSIDGGETSQASNEFLNLENGTYIVGVIDENNCSSFEQVIINITSTNELTALKFEVFPNPSEGIFTLQFSSEIGSDFEIEIFDVLGQTVYTEKINNAQRHPIDVHQLAAGTYQLRISDGKSFGIKSIVLVKK